MMCEMLDTSSAADNVVPPGFALRPLGRPSSHGRGRLAPYRRDHIGPEVFKAGEEFFQSRFVRQKIIRGSAYAFQQLD